MNNNYFSEFKIIGSTVKSIKIKNDFLSLNNNNDMKRTIDISHLVGNTELIDDGKTFFGTIILNIKVKISQKKKKYDLDMSIEGCFKAPIEIGEDTFKDMLEVNGIASLYSIARGFVQSTSSQTLLSGSVLLPLINAIEYSRNMSEKNKES